MFTCNYKTLRVSFNEFHNTEDKERPQYGEFCLLELKDGRHTAGEWHPSGGDKSLNGKFIRGTADTVEIGEVAKWHTLERYDLTECLETEELNWINLGHEKEDGYSVQFEGFKSINDGDLPKNDQYCLLIRNDGSLAAGRWDELRNCDVPGSFIYAPALASYSIKEVWAWTALSNDEVFDVELEREREEKEEEELNRNPSTDAELFKYGKKIDVYYEKALEKLRKDYHWATLNMMKKKEPFEIAPLHGKYVFGHVSKSWYNGAPVVQEWKEGKTADEFIDFLCEYTRETVKENNPEEKFKYGLDIQVYLDKAFENTKKDYRWLDKKMLKDCYQYDIKKVKGDLEFVSRYGNEGKFTVENAESADRFIEWVTHEYQNAALRANKSVATYNVSFKGVEIHGWHLERYTFYKLKSGDYKVSVTAGDRTTGGSRDFFITPYCFEAKTYEEFLDRYEEIVPGGSFGLYKEDLLPDEKLKKFLGY